MNRNVHERRIILLVDDDEDDRLMLQEAFKKIGEPCHFVEAANGEDALMRLKDLIYTANEWPCLIVLDVNMPKMNGRETFLALRKNEKTVSIPIVVFSTSHNENDKEYFKGDNTTYISKPARFNDLVNLAKGLFNYCEDEAIPATGAKT